MPKRILLFLIAMFAVCLIGTASANASYQRFLPGGLPTNSTQAATKAVLDYADLNQGYGKIIAQQTGAHSFNPNDYVAAGWGKASSDTKNSALSGSGSAVAYNDASSVGVRTIRIRNTKTGLLVNVMVRCGNPRVKSGVQVVKKVHIQKILRIFVNKKFSITRTITCPSGQQVKGTVTGYVRGWFKTKVKGWTTGAKLYYSLQVDLAVTNTLKLKCGAAPTAPPAASCTNGSVTPTNSGIACQGNNASEQSKQDATVHNACDQTHTSNSEQCNTVITQITIQYITQINANCSKVVYSNGNVVFTDNNGNTVTENYCSSQNTCTGTSCNTPPPTCEQLHNCPPPPSCTNGSSGPYPACPLPQPSSANCTKLTLTQNPTVNLGIRAHVDYSMQNATLSSVTFTWGDSTTTTVTGSDADHTYARGGNYIVNATLKFTSPNGNLSSTCSAQQITPKDGTPGAGTPPTGGPGSGGTPTPTPGATGTPCYMPDGSLGYTDQMGNCNPA